MLSSVARSTLHYFPHYLTNDMVFEKYSECDFVALVIQLTERMRHIVICSPLDSTLFSTLSHKRHGLKKSSVWIRKTN